VPPDLAEEDARQQAADLNVTFNQYVQRDQADRKKSARRSRWSQPPGLLQGDLDYLVKERQEWPGTASRPTSRVDQSC
jgi:hypothetical protein